MDKQIQDPDGQTAAGNPAGDTGADEPVKEVVHPIHNGAKRRRVKNVPLLIAEIVALFLAAGVLYVVIVATKDVERRNLDRDKITVNEEIAETAKAGESDTSADTEKGYYNIALFGVDARDGELGRGTRSDSIIIASINMDTQEIKLISVFRDTFLNLGNDSYNKCNAAYAQGGPEQAISMLNTNLDLNITDYVTVGFGGLMDSVDALGGIEMEVTEAEISHLNNYQLSMSEELGVDYIPIEHSGKQLLNGLQATAYCRIRYTKGDDFRRAERQRDVLTAMMNKAKGASVSSLTEMVQSILPEVQTSLGVNEILSVLGSVAGYEVVASDGFPFEDGRVGVNVGSKGSCVIPDDLQENVAALHELLYPEQDYKPSKRVESISAEIAALTDAYRN